MRMLKSTFAKKAVCLISALALTLGMVPLTALSSVAYAEPDQASTSVQLVEGTYIEGEALVYMVDLSSDGTMMFSARDYQAEDDLLANAENIMDISTPVEQDDGIMAFSLRESEPQPEMKGSIRLVKSSILSTAELIDELLNDPRVSYAEPNYIIQSAENENTGDAQQGEDLDQPTEPVETNKKASEHETEKASESEEETTNLTALADEGTDATLTSSTWGPTSYAADDIPDMTMWQWGNYNNGSMAGTYTPNTVPDIKYSNWNKKDAVQDLPTVVVGVIDYGVDERNPDLSGVLWTGQSFGAGGDKHGFNTQTAVPGATSTTNITDHHGTHVAGIIAAKWNGKGTSGVAGNVQIMSLRYSDSLASILQCFNYVKLARENGVDIVATNNSWALGLNTSDLINLAVTELGQMGVVSVFASGNSSENTDIALESCATFANNPYAITVDSITPKGSVSAFSNYGIATTDLAAAGSTILSTFGVDEPILQFLGETDAHATGSAARANLVSYTSFDDKSVRPLKFSIAVDSSGTPYGSDLNDSSEKPDVGAFDGESVLSLDTISSGDMLGRADIISDPKDLSSLAQKPRYVSLRLISKDSKIAIPQFVAVPVIETMADGSQHAVEWKCQANGLSHFGGFVDSYLGCYFDISEAETLSDADNAAGIVSRVVNWRAFRLHICTAVREGGQAASGTVYIDSIALGSGRYPFAYDQGTSMACPEVTGALAAIAGEQEGRLGTRGTAAYAEKLAALTKGAGERGSRYATTCATACATGAYATVDGANDPGPAIVSVADGDDSFTITGYFMNDATVKLGDTSCSVTAYTDLSNDKYELTVQKPAGFEGGGSTVTVSSDASGKMDRSVFEFAAKPSISTYEGIEIPADVAADIAQWTNYDLVPYAGKIYIVPRSAGTSLLESFSKNCMYAYDIESGTFTKVPIPLEDLAVEGAQYIGNAADITACTVGGKLMLLITGYYPQNPALAMSLYASLDSDGKWTPLGLAQSQIAIPSLCTLASDGENVYTFGGLVLTSSGMQVPGTIFKITTNDQWDIVLEPATSQVDYRITPRVAYSDDKFVLSGGSGTGGPVASGDGLPGMEIVSLGDNTKIDVTSSLFNTEQHLTYSAGGLADGSFLVVGATRADGTADTYTLSADGTVAAYNKRAQSANILNPASVSYNGKFYAFGIKSADTSGSTPFLCATPVNTADVQGDALIDSERIQSSDPVVDEGVPAFSNTPVSVTTKDIYDNFGLLEGSRIVNAVNKAADRSIVYLELTKLLEADVPATDHEAILAAAEEQGVTDELFWLDISLFLQAPQGAAPLQMHSVLNGIDVTLGVPDFPELQEDYTRTYKVFAYHAQAPEGQRLEIIDPTYNAEDDTLHFTIDRCSTYAVGYEDTADPAPDPTPDPTPSPAAKTGDTMLSIVLPLCGIAALAIIVMIVAWRKRRSC